MFKGFVLGVIVAVLVALGAGYGALRAGIIPANADATPGSLERFVAGTSLRATLAREAPQGAVPVALNDDNLNQGIHLYSTRCAVCHGLSDGEPSPIAKGEYPKPPQLGRRGLARDPEGRIFWIIEHGIRWTGMPSWKASMSEDDAWKIALFLKNLSKLPPGPEATWKSMHREQTPASPTAAPTSAPASAPESAPAPAPANP
jgi:thiosulfate dehydrogenase